MRNIANGTSPYPLRKGDFLLVILNAVKNLKSASVCILVHAFEILRFSQDDKTREREKEIQFPHFSSSN